VMRVFGIHVVGPFFEIAIDRFLFDHVPDVIESRFVGSGITARGFEPVLGYEPAIDGTVTRRHLRGRVPGDAPTNGIHLEERYGLPGLLEEPGARDTDDSGPDDRHIHIQLSDEGWVTFRFGGRRHPVRRIRWGVDVALLSLEPSLSTHSFKKATRGQKVPVAESKQDRELIELLNELRVALPGIQVLFAFLLIVPFSQGFAGVSDTQKLVYFLSFLSTSMATALLIAPTAYHRIRWRAHDKEQMLVTSNRMTIAGTAFLALAMSLVVFFISDVLYGNWSAWLTAAAAGTFAWLWFGLPIVRAARD
jgi:hypothetical protein